MYALLPLQLIDSFLLRYTVGDVFLLALGLSILAALAMRSQKVLSAQATVFGLLLLLTPSSALAPAQSSFLTAILQYKMLGLVLLVAGPILYTTAKR